MKRFTLVAITFLLVGAGIVRAQNRPAVNSYSYNNAIGLRAGGTSGLTFKHFMSSDRAFEGILGLWRHGFSVTGLYEIYAGTGAPGLRWYYGFGGHVAAYEHRYYYVYDDRPGYRYRDNSFGLGIDGIVGLEYKINPIPFAISLDLKPMIEVNNHGDAFWAIDPGLGIKFTF